jgi:2-polyprenyl-3-methyl-5-hydroxy-6-metoxy-1,4-benzoquinol methylase
MSPLSNAYLTAEQTGKMEPFYPLHAYVCEGCFLVQLEEFQSPENIFSDYAYFSSYSDTWLKHAQDYAEHATKRFGLSPAALVVEIASNDGYLLQYFKRAGIPVLGIEPAGNVARVAQEAGIPTRTEFFGTTLAKQLVAEAKHADLLIGNNVLAHVPDLNDFVAGMKIILKRGGSITLEFPHLLRLMEQNQFDTIYHEHFSYFSFTTAEKVLGRHGLEVFDVEELATHGGSLRLYACHAGEKGHPVTPSPQRLRERESKFGLTDLAAYLSFSEQVRETKRALLSFLIEAKRKGQSIVGYGAPAKGNTLLNYCGIGTDFLDYTVDRNPHKQGRFLPGTHIPIHAPERIVETKPDYVLILPWNLKDEIIEQMAVVREWGGKFVVPIPQVTVYG